MKDQIFISYRRDGGEAMAQLLHDKLTNKGFHVFYDIESLNSGPFDEKLYQKIEECEDFLLVLPPQALDRCTFEEDWIRCEIRHALQHQRNIIPILMRGFVFPQTLPEDIQPVCKRNGIEFQSMEFLEAKIEKIISMLTSKTCDKVDQTLDDKLNEKFNNLFSGKANSDNRDKQTIVQKKIENRQYYNHVTSFVPEECFGDKQKSMFCLPVNDTGFSIKSPAHIKFAAFEFSVNQYDYDSFTTFPKINISELSKEERFENEFLITEFKLDEKNNDSSLCGKQIILISTDTNLLISYIFVSLKLNIINTKGIEAFFSQSRMIRLDYSKKTTQTCSNVFFEEPYKERDLKTFDANKAPKAIIIDPETGNTVLRQYAQSEGGEKTPQITLETYKNYLTFMLNLTFDNNDIREMTAKEIADCYYKGNSGFPCDKMKALEYYEMDGSAESLFIIANFFCKDEKYYDKDSGLEYMSQAANKGHLEAIQYLADYYFYEEKNDAAAIPYLKLLVESHQKNVIGNPSDRNRSTLAKSCYLLARSLCCTKLYSDAEVNYMQALDLYNIISTDTCIENIANIHFWLAELYFEQDEYLRPKECLLKAIEYYSACNPQDEWIQERIALSFNNLAFAYKNLKLLQDAESAYIDAYKIRKKLAQTNFSQYAEKYRFACKKLIDFYDLIGDSEKKSKFLNELSQIGVV